jgi:hypothetical protein
LKYETNGIQFVGQKANEQISEEILKMYSLPAWIKELENNLEKDYRTCAVERVNGWSDSMTASS